MCLFKQKLRPILRWLCWFKSSGYDCRGGCRKFSDAVMTIFSGQSVISRVYTSRFGNGTARWNLDRSGTKKVSGTRYSTQWKTPQKWTVPYRTVPYHAVEKRHLRTAGIDIGGSKCEPSPRYFFLSSVADQIVKTNRPGHQRMNWGLSMEWEVRELLGLWIQQFIIQPIFRVSC